MSIRSKIKSAVKKVASGIKSGFQNAMRGDWSGTKKTVKNVVNNAKTAFSNVSSQSQNASASVRTATTPRTITPSTSSPSTSSLSASSLLNSPGLTVNRSGSKGVDLSKLSFEQDTARITPGMPGLSFNSYGGATPTPTTLMGGQRTPSRNITSPESPISSSTITSRQGSTGADLGISSESLSSAPSVSLPDAPSYTDVGTVNNAGLIGALQESGQTFDPESGLFVPDNKDNTASEDERRKKDFEDLLGMTPTRESVYDDKDVKKQQEEVQQRKQELNNYTAQLNNVVAKQNADLLRTRGTLSEEGGTEAVYGGIAATINREAAIKALPIQAQIAAAQGNVELAQDYLSELIAVKKDQIAADFEYNMTKFKAIEGYLTKEEKIRLDEISKNEERAYSRTEKNLDLQDEWAKYAIQNGQGHLVSRIHGLNAGSPDFQQKLGDIVSNIQDLDAAKKMNDNSGDGGIELTDEDERILAGSGLSSGEINSIASDVSKYGIDAVLEGMSDQRQKDAIMRVYGGSEGVSKLTRTSVANLFGMSDNDELSGFLGFFGKGKTNSEKLDELMDTISKYQAVGYSDADIMKLMKESD